jgi:hypothetical protein
VGAIYVALKDCLKIVSRQCVPEAVESPYSLNFDFCNSRPLTRCRDEAERRTFESELVNDAVDRGEWGP